MSCSAVSAFAEVSFFLQEAIGFAAKWNSAGHASVHLSNVCTDNYTRLRVCQPGERGVVLSSFRNLGAEENYEWVAMPLVPFLYGVEDEGKTPLYVNAEILAALRERYRREHLRELVPMANAGYWQHLVGATLERDIYAFTVTTTAEQDAAFIDAFNCAPNVNHFRQFTNNCTDFAAKVLNQYFPRSAHRDWLNDFGTITPKAVAHSFTKYAKKHPALQFRVTKYAQAHGTLARSQDARKLTQEALTSPKYFAPLAYWHPYLAAGFAGSYLLFGRFNAAREYHRHTADVAAFGTKQDWNHYRAQYETLLSQARARGLVADASSVTRFFQELAQQTEPGFDDEGALILKHKATGQTLGLTRNNLSNHNRTLACQLLLAKIQTELSAAEKKRASFHSFQQQWNWLVQLSAAD
ncbi:MAG: hypothetical protein U0Y68_21930 [Blastocatellia bacterium]